MFIRAVFILFLKLYSTAIKKIGKRLLFIKRTALSNLPWSERLLTTCSLIGNFPKKEFPLSQFPSVTNKKTDRALKMGNQIKTKPKRKEKGISMRY